MVVKGYDEVVLRLSVDDFFRVKVLNSNNLNKEESPERQLLQDHNDRRDLFIQAFARMAAKDKDDPYSFYQIAGIHGWPGLSYDKAQNPPKGTGYCAHGSTLFPTWHRPYLLLIENALQRSAAELVQARFGSRESSNEAQNSPDKEERKKKAQKARAWRMVDQLRMPYWDWASLEAQVVGVPEIFIERELTVSFLRDSETSLPNPLRTFVLPVDLAGPHPQYAYASQPENLPTSRPFYSPPNSAPLTPAFFNTVRYPDSKYQSQEPLQQLNMIRNVGMIIRPCVFSLFPVDDWRIFSNHYSTGVEDEMTYGSLNSLELIHDQVHDTLGGPGGHMAYPQVAGFDPIFFFHHCNVDRILALWQIMHREKWVLEKGKAQQGEEHSTTPLVPFRAKWSPEGGDEYWNSDQARDFIQLGYNYPEIAAAAEDAANVKINAADKQLEEAEKQADKEAKKQAKEKAEKAMREAKREKEKALNPKSLDDLEVIDSMQFLGRMRGYYEPDSWHSYRWNLHVRDIPKNRFSGPYRVRVFIGVRADENPLDLKISDPRFVGNIYVFSRGKEGARDCDNCKRQKDRGQVNIQGSLDITRVMRLLQMNVDIPDNAPTPKGPVLEQTRNVYPAAFAETQDLQRHDPGELKWSVTTSLHLGSSDEDKDLDGAQSYAGSVKPSPLLSSSAEGKDRDGGPEELLERASMAGMKPFKVGMKPPQADPAEQRRRLLFTVIPFTKPLF